MKKILLVEDEEMLRDFLSRLIERRGFIVWAVPTAEEGLKIFKEDKPDCSLLDINLPGMDGTVLFEKIREIDPQSKVYFITGSTAFLEKAKALGANGYIVKPVEAQEIMKALAQI